MVKIVVVVVVVVNDIPSSCIKMNYIQVLLNNYNHIDSSVYNVLFVYVYFVG